MMNLGKHEQPYLESLTLTKVSADLPVDFSKVSETVMQLLGGESVDLIIGDIIAGDNVDKVTVYLSSHIGVEEISQELRDEFDGVFSVN